MDLKGGPKGRVLQDVALHGGRAIVPRKGEEEPAREQCRLVESTTVVEAPHGPYDDATFCDGSTAFDYAFEDLAGPRYEESHLPKPATPADAAATVEALRRLAEAMVEQDPAGVPTTSSIPAIYTYWGQFIDHDLTANTDREGKVSDITRPDLDALDPDDVRRNLRNLRHPALNLDAVYGGGPDDPASARFYEGARFRIGRVDTAPGIPGVLVPPDDDLARDLPRQDAPPGEPRLADIADLRNDENLVVAQFHLAFLRFHNEVVRSVCTHDPDCAEDEAEAFRCARRLTEWHYQWLVVNDFLRTVTRRGTVEQVLAGGDPRFDPRGGEPYMPLEFSVGAFRFGHSMVRGGYDHNRNFGKPGLNVAPFASLDQLFQFTGGGGFRGGEVLPFNWVIEWDRFVDKGDTDATHFARKIDTNIAPPLQQLVKEGNEVTEPRLVALLKNLAHRNLLRAYHLSVPTGQAVAGALGVDPLTPEELAPADTPLAAALREGGFLERTPLWYYVLREAEVRANGNTLGEVGSRIVAETIIGQVRNDPTSYLAQTPEWTPADGVKVDGRAVTSISDLLRVAGVLA